MLTHGWIQRAGIGVAIIALCAGIGCGGGGDDGDGGSLSAREETAVQEWFTGLAAAAQSMDAGMPSGGPGQMPDFSAMRRTLGEIADMSPPRVSDNTANGALRDLHNGMSTMIEAMDEAFEIMEDASGPADMAAAMQAMTRMQTALDEAMPQMQAAAQTLHTILQVDFSDNPQAMAQMQQAFTGFQIEGPIGPPAGRTAAPSSGGLSK